jgi:hypothetical protein
MSLPLQAVDRLFDRLTASYGRQFVNLYEGMDMNAVKSTWAHELSGYGHNLKAIAWALENLPDRAPNVIAFRTLCRQAPATEVPLLPLPKADPERMRAELAKLAPLRAQVVAASGHDHKAWARRIVARHAAGEKINPTSLLFARQAVRFQPETEAA